MKTTSFIKKRPSQYFGLLLAGTILLMLAILTVVGTFVSDMILMWIDPRIRFGMEGRN